MTPKKKGKKGKKPDYRKTETFQDYKSAAATFADYNPGTDTVFVGSSIDPGMAEQKTQRAANISKAKGASDNNYNSIPKMYKTKNESGQTVYVSVSKHSKYEKGGMMKAKKYEKGGQVSFGKAFSEARKSGSRTFEYKGKKYGTRLKGESDEKYKSYLESKSKVDLKSKDASKVNIKKANETQAKNDAKRKAAAKAPKSGSAVSRPQREESFVKGLKQEATKRSAKSTETEKDMKKFDIKKPKVEIKEANPKRGLTSKKEGKTSLKSKSAPRFEAKGATKLQKSQDELKRNHKESTAYGGILDEVTVTAKAPKKSAVLRAINKARAKRRAKNRK